MSRETASDEQTERSSFMQNMDESELTRYDRHTVSKLLHDALDGVEDNDLGFVNTNSLSLEARETYGIEFIQAKVDTMMFDRVDPLLVEVWIDTEEMGLEDPAPTLRDNDSHEEDRFTVLGDDLFSEVQCHLDLPYGRTGEALSYGGMYSERDELYWANAEYMQTSVIYRAGFYSPIWG